MPQTILPIDGNKKIALCRMPPGGLADPCRILADFMLLCFYVNGLNLGFTDSPVSFF